MIGLSDHTTDIVSSLSASANNVVAIEKHFKLKKQSQWTLNSQSIQMG